MIPYYEQTGPTLRVLHAGAQSYPSHLHGAVELIYQKEGTMGLVVNGQRYVVPPKHLAVIFPNLLHEYFVVSEEPCASLYVIFEPSILPEYLPCLLRKVPENLILSPDQLHDDVLYGLRRLENEYVGEREANAEKAFLLLIMSRILKHLVLVGANTDADSSLTYRVTQYISENFTKNISLGQMSREFGVSKFCLSRIFSQQFHMNFREYLNLFRLDYASTLLLTTNQKLNSISQSVGFENQRTFNRVFREHYQMTPSEYRRLQI